MRGFVHRPCSLVTLGALFALLAGAAFAPPAVQAGCGDHVQVLTPARDVPVSAVSHPIVPAQKHAPCSGPHCTRSPLTPAPAPVLPPAPGAQEWACVLDPVPLPAPGSSGYQPD